MDNNDRTYKLGNVADLEELLKELVQLDENLDQLEESLKEMWQYEVLPQGEVPAPKAVYSGILGKMVDPDTGEPVE